MSGQVDYTILDEQAGETVWPCNECGRLVPVGDELCGPCYDDQCREEEWERMNPEGRCPPRE